MVGVVGAVVHRIWGTFRQPDLVECETEDMLCGERVEPRGKLIHTVSGKKQIYLKVRYLQYSFLNIHLISVIVSVLLCTSLDISYRLYSTMYLSLMIFYQGVVRVHC